MTWTQDSLKHWLDTIDVNNPQHRDAVGRALLFMYSRQTHDEQTDGHTKHRNGRGFSGSDCDFLSSVAQRYERYGTLSPKQTTCVARALKKYTGQLLLMVEAKQASTVASPPATPSQSALTSALTSSHKLCGTCGDLYDSSKGSCGCNDYSTVGPLAELF